MKTPACSKAFNEASSIHQRVTAQSTAPPLQKEKRTEMTSHTEEPANAVPPTVGVKLLEGKIFVAKPIHPDPRRYHYPGSPYVNGGDTRGFFTPICDCDWRTHTTLVTSEYFDATPQTPEEKILCEEYVQLDGKAAADFYNKHGEKGIQDHVLYCEGYCGRLFLGWFLDGVGFALSRTGAMLSLTRTPECNRRVGTLKRFRELHRCPSLNTSAAPNPQC